MEKEFIPYEQSLELKELGFDEKCFLYYGENNILRVFTITIKDFITNSELPPQYNTCPTFSQAFRWFREKYDLCGEVYTVNMGAIDYTFLIRDLYSENVKYDNFEANTGGYSGTFTIYEEVELECLKKLIEIVKQK